MLPQRLLLGPGPSGVHPDVLSAMSQPMIGHLDPQFIEFMDDLQCKLRNLFKTKNEVTFAASGTGSAGMEMCLANLLEPDDPVVICINGVFGTRMAEIANRLGAIVFPLDTPWGNPVDIDEALSLIRTAHPKLVAIVHAETSTGVHQPLTEISKVTHEVGALFLVDAVTSLGGVDVRMDEWGIDAIYSGTQKCLSAPPSLSPVSFSPNAMKVIQNRKRRPFTWYLDISLLTNYWGGKRAYHHTAPISSLYGLYAAIQLVEAEGLENRFSRHKNVHNLLREKLEDCGFTFIVHEDYRLPMLNAVRPPNGIDALKLQHELLVNHNIEVGAGLGRFAGDIIRIGIMGYTCTEENVNKLMDAIHTELKYGNTRKNN